VSGASFTVLGFVLAGAALAGACASPRGGAPVAETTAATHRDTCRRVAPACAPGDNPGSDAEARAVLQRRCFGCHAAGGEAAEEHDFSRDEVVSAQRELVAREVAACAMPPSLQPPLTDAEADVLLRWGGCARGERSAR